MKKRINKHIEKKDFVKVYLADHNGIDLTKFSGILFDQNEEFVLLCAFSDFRYDGFVVFSKSDISEIQKEQNEDFYYKILAAEGIIESVTEQYNTLNFELGSHREMFDSLKTRGMSVIVENLYIEKNVFLIGPIFETKKKKVFIDYINARGEYDLKPTAIDYKNITFFSFDDRYSSMYLKYSKRVD